MTQTRAIIGLGNPGEQYRHTRHNCGFRFIDALAAQCQLQLKLNPRLKANLVRTTVSEVPVWLVEPITYMNRSGTAFQLVTNYYDIDPGNAIVVHDDLDLPAGVVRLKLTEILSGNRRAWRAQWSQRHHFQNRKPRFSTDTHRYRPPQSKGRHHSLRTEYSVIARSESY